MKLYKRILSTPAIQRMVAVTGAAILKLINRTIRWERHGDDITDRLVAEGRPFIGCFWHGRLMAIGRCWRHAEGSHIVISRHRDGRIVAHAFEQFGFSTIAGSTGKHGSEAMRAMVRLLRSGGRLGITPDGPRGPRMRVSPGLVAVARVGGVPIVPMTASVSRRRVLRSWDRFIIPLPFSRGIYLVGEPIEVPRNADEATMERIRLQVEERLNALTDEADDRMKMPRIEPAAPAATRSAGGQPDAPGPVAGGATVP